MTSPLAQLTGQSAPTDPQQAPAPTAAPGTGADHPLLDAMVSGQLPGLNVPKNFRPSPELNSITLPHIQAAGLSAYRPHDPTLAMSVFNPKIVSPADVQAADKAGKLPTLFPSVAQFDGGASGGADGASGGLSASAAGAVSSSPTSSQQPSSVPVLPRPASAASQQPLATARARLMNQLPTDRAVPAGGQILNGLLQPAV